MAALSLGLARRQLQQLAAGSNISSHWACSSLSGAVGAGRACLHTVSRVAADMDAHILGIQALRISRYGPGGFTVNDRNLAGSIAIANSNVLKWAVKDPSQLTEESLSLFTVCDPPIEILVLGTGDKLHALEPRIREFLRKHHILVEVHATKNACGTFNFLQEEGRSVGAALIPLSRPAAAATAGAAAAATVTAKPSQ
eukprot:m.53835 g.53835  ORF g.53835 m.53835 type:complete len:198 (+) comp13200_c0_seq1:135-728(+)